MSDSPLADAYRDCLPILDQMRTGGVPFKERVKSLEAVIRQFWPFTRDWHYLCANCLDYGLEMRTCEGQGCGMAHGKPHLPHEYGVPCWCSLGQRFKSRERTEATAIEAAAKVKKPTRFGR